MNTVQDRRQQADAQELPQDTLERLLERPYGGGVGAATLILKNNGEAFARMVHTAELMAGGEVTVPAHLRGNKSDCLAIVMKAVQWNMDPWAVASKTHVTKSGLLGYEAQLVNAVVIQSGLLSARPDWEFIGPWSNIFGRFREEKGTNGGKYYVQAWSEKDEIGIGVTCYAHFKGEAEPRSITVMLSQCWPRFSTQWATDPQQQITYISLRKMVRRYAPDVLMGVYTPDELEDGTAEEESQRPLAEQKRPTRKSATPKNGATDPKEDHVSPPVGDQGSEDPPPPKNVAPNNKAETTGAATATVTESMLRVLRTKLSGRGALDQVEPAFCAALGVDRLESIAVADVNAAIKKAGEFSL